MRKLLTIPWLRKKAPGVPCAVCEGYGTVMAPWALGRERKCNCGATAANPGKLAEMVLHAPSCDTLPCPFCKLED